jgi:transcriptional regulator with XRE-family HTH domain
MRIAITELARARIAAGLSQKDLAARVGIAQGTLSAVENGWRVAWPKLRAACAAELGIPEDTLFPQHERGVRSVSGDAA